MANPRNLPGHRSYAEQLTDTVRFAVEHIPWYRERADRYAGPITSAEDLARLPILDRADVRADPRAFASSSEWPSSISYSSSTTGGVGQPRWRSDAEQRELAALIAAAPADDDGITLAVHPLDQGAPAAPSSVTRRLTAGLLVPWHFEWIHQVLRDGWESPSGCVRVTTLDGFSPGLRVLTHWLLDRGIDPSTFGVRRIYGYGSIQPGHWRRRLEAVWGATYQDLYGLSEVMLSDAAQCPLCGAYHHRLPIVPEVLDLVTREPIEEGVGGLVLTELYPYAQLQLLVRYWTDDIVELAPPCPLGSFGIFVRGRRSMSAVIEHGPGRRLVVGGLQVGEVVAEHPDVAVTTLAWAPWATEAGAPRFRLEVRGSTIVATVGLRYDPGQFPAAAAAFVASILAQLRARVTGLAEWIDDGLVDLQVQTVPADLLGDPLKV